MTTGNGLDRPVQLLSYLSWLNGVICPSVSASSPAYLPPNNPEMQHPSTHIINPMQSILCSSTKNKSHFGWNEESVLFYLFAFSKREIGASVFFRYMLILGFFLCFTVNLYLLIGIYLNTSLAERMTVTYHQGQPHTIKARL